MSSAVETEVKVRVSRDSWLKARKWLEHHCGDGKTVRQKDVYYSHPCRDFALTDEALRIRWLDQECVLTYKGPRISRDGVKSREELKARLDSNECSGLEKMLSRLGFSPVATVEKEREKYLCPGGYKVALDRVEDLGLFIEVEVKGESHDAVERVKAFIKDLGIEGEVVEETYLEMLLRHRGSRDSV